MAIELLQINEDFYNYLENPYESRLDDFVLETFTQMWGNTSGGFQGIGGSMMTEQRTYVFIPKKETEKCLVFFGSRLGYKVDKTERFIEDVKNRSVAGVVSSKKRYNIQDK